MTVYKNSTELMQLSGIPIYMNDLVDACLLSKLNLFLQGDTGSGKTQLAADTMSYFPDKSVFILGRNDMDVRDIFQQVNLNALRTGKSSAEIKELTDKVGYHLIVVDELTNCVPAVRAQLFNLFDGYIEINGERYDIGAGYSLGIATGNLGQKFTESSNDLGRALKDRMHVIVDTDYFKPTPSDTLEILAENTNPRVEFSNGNDRSEEIVESSKELRSRRVPLNKFLIANYFVHGLDYCEGPGGEAKSKTRMKDAWPNQITNHGRGSDEALIFPSSMRAAKSITILSQALDDIAKRKGAETVDPFESMTQAYKFVSANSGGLNEASVQANYYGDRYSAIDELIITTRAQFDREAEKIASGLEMVNSGKLDERVLSLFDKRWGFMRDILQGLLNKSKTHTGDLQENENRNT